MNNQGVLALLTNFTLDLEEKSDEWETTLTNDIVNSLASPRKRRNTKTSVKSHLIGSKLSSDGLSKLGVDDEDERLISFY